MANQKIKIAPVAPKDFKFAEHAYRSFSASVDPSYKEKLEDPALWVNVAPKINIGDEIRILSDDLSWVAYGICLNAQGSQVKFRITKGFDLDAVADEDGNLNDAPFLAKQRGQKKWCIQDTTTGDWIREGISTQAECYREIDELIKIMGS